MTVDLRELVAQLRELARKALKGDGVWQSGIAGGCNLVHFNGEDVVGIGFVNDVDKRKLIAALVNALPALLDALEEKWIPASERLPDADIDVLVFIRWGAENYGVAMDRYNVHGIEEWQSYQPLVTHWMPLPAAPEKGNLAGGKS